MLTPPRPYRNHQIQNPVKYIAMDPQCQTPSKKQMNIEHIHLSDCLLCLLGASIL